MRCLDERLDLPGDLVRLLAWELQVPVLELLDWQARTTGTVMRFQAIELVRLFGRYSERLQWLGRGAESAAWLAGGVMRMSVCERLYLICYDICDPGRLNRVARFLCKHACRVQYSVFVIEITPERLTSLSAELEALIEPEEDDVRAYLPAECEMAMLGRQLFPNDILLLRDGRNVLRLVESVDED